MAHRNDMGSLYASHMGHFGCGVAMYHPVSAADMTPPCVGYLDRNARWNHIANVPFPPKGPKPGIYEPLDNIPQKMAQLNIEWRPRTSLGVRQYMVEGKAETVNGLPASADASVKYASKTSFGAILIAQKPVTHTSYNDETLFRHWIRDNAQQLAIHHGVELSRYGLWLVTRTYTSPRASINAWKNKDKDATVSVKAKADMMGDLGATLDWSEKGTDKDWVHYAAEEGVVTFFDGIEVPGWQWWLDGMKARIGKDFGLIKRRVTLNRSGLGPTGSWKPVKNGRAKRPSVAPGADDVWVSQSPADFKKATVKEPLSLPPLKEKPPLEEKHSSDDDPALEDLWGSSTPLRDPSPMPRSLSRGRPQSVSLRHSRRNISAPTRHSLILDDQGHSQRDFTDLTLRLSTASTAAANPSVAKANNHGVDEKDFFDRSPPQVLKRKVSSLSMRSKTPPEMQL